MVGIETAEQAEIISALDLRREAIETKTNPAEQHYATAIALAEALRDDGCDWGHDSESGDLTGCSCTASEPCAYRREATARMGEAADRYLKAVEHHQGGRHDKAAQALSAGRSLEEHYGDDPIGQQVAEALEAARAAKLVHGVTVSVEAGEGDEDTDKLHATLTDGTEVEVAVERHSDGRPGYGPSGDSLSTWLDPDLTDSLGERISHLVCRELVARAS